MILALFLDSNYPYYIQNEEKSVDIPVNTMDCIRIYQKLNELKENPDSYPILWTPLHIATFNLKEMTVAMNDQVF